MIKSTFKLSLKFLAAIVLTLALAGVAVMWRLSNGPISIAFLVGPIENLINRNVDDLSVEIKNVIVERAKDRLAVRLRFVDLSVRDQEGKLVAKAPRAALRMKGRDLLNGQFTPSNLELLGPKLLLHRKQTGEFRLGFGEIGAVSKSETSPVISAKSTGEGDNAAPATPGNAGDVAESAEDMIALLRATLLSDEQDGPTANLSSIMITDAVLTVYDEPNSTIWISPNANLSFLRIADGLSVRVDGDIKVGQQSFSLSAQARYLKNSQRLSVTAAIQDVNPETLAKHVPDLDVMKILHFPISGTASAEIGLDGRLLNADLDIKLGSGRFIFSEKQEDDLALTSGRISLKYDKEKRLLVIAPSQIDMSGGKATLSGFLVPEGDAGNPFSDFGYNLELANIKIAGKKTIEIDRIIAIGTADSDNTIINFETAELHAGDARISFAGRVKAKKDAPAIRLKGNIDNLSTAKLMEIWPLELARGLRVWIDENLTAFVPSGSFAVDIDEKEFAQLVAGGEVPKDFLTAEFKVTDATVRYFEGLPPLKQAYGRGVLNDGDFNFYGEGGVATVASGKKVNLTKATFHTNWAISDPAIGKVRAFVKGSISSVMELLDNEPLRFGKKMGINPKILGGRATGDLLFTMPLLADLPVEKVDIKAKAKLVNTRIPKAFGDFDVTKGNFDLDITMFGLTGKGSLELKGTKGRLTWVENFGVKGKRKSEFRLKAMLDGAARKRMGIDLSAFMSGPAAVDFTLKGSGPNLDRAHVVADLTKATLFRRPIGWYSPPGNKATATLDMTFLDGGAIDLKNIEVVSPKREVFVAGNLSLDKKGEITSLEFPDIRLGAINRYGARGKRSAPRVLNLQVTGASFDARAIIDNAMKRGKNSSQSNTKDRDRQTINLTANIDTVYGHNKQVFKNVAARVTTLGADAVLVETKAKINGRKAFELTYKKNGGNSNNLRITSNDAGAALKAFDLYSKVTKGQLQLKAVLNPEGSGKPSTGELKVKNFDVANDDRLKGITKSAGSNSEEIELILRDSVSFSSLKMPFQLLKDRVVVKNALVKGPILGASGRGFINTKTQSINLEGTLIPIYAVNSLIGEIPILGKILVGRKGEGVFGMTFSLRGPTKNPQFSVNPVSALAPGFLRQFFENGTPRPVSNRQKKSAPLQLRPQPKLKLKSNPKNTEDFRDGSSEN